MPTVNINETFHLRDNWNEEIFPISVSIDETFHLRDTLEQDIDSTEKLVFINEEFHLRDSYNIYIADASGDVSVAINETFHLRDSYVREVLGYSGLVEFIFDEFHLRDEIDIDVQETYQYERNANISFGETKEPGYKEYSHRFRWTNYNGIAVPDLNYKDLKEPIVRMMPAPSFLQFEYANSFLLFTRNTINRFVLKADVETGQWRAETDNLIEEFKDLGLMEPKTLVLAGDTLFGLSEKGVWKWNKDGMELISDKIIDLPDAGVYEYIGFYSSIRNQYILHRQEGFGQYLQLTTGTPTELPDNGGSTGVGQVGAVMLTDTKFIHISWSDTNSGRAVIGTIDAANNLISFSANIAIAGLEHYYNDVIPMFNGDGFVVAHKSSANPRKVTGGTATGAAPTTGLNVTCAHSTNDYIELAKLSETRFAVFGNQTDYQTGTIAWGGGTPVITLDVAQTNWLSPGWDMLKTVYISEGVSVIIYTTDGSTVRARFITDNGDGTLAFGTALNTGISTNWVQDLDAKLASSTLIFMVIGETDDIILAPLVLDTTAKTITIGNIATKAGWIDSAGGHSNLTIANRGSSGFWLFFEDANNSSYLTAMWGAGSVTDMTLATSIKTVIQTELTYSLNAIAVVGGKALLHYSKGGALTDDGFASIWGLDYAAIDSFVYQIDRDKWTRFLGMDISDIPVILSGGSLDENYNLWLDSNRQLMKYPGTAYTAVEAVIRTKEFYIEKGAFQRWMVDFEGSSVDVETRVKKMVGGSVVNEEDIKYNVDPNKFRGISLDKQRGYQMSIKIINADILKGFSFDSKKWGEN